MVRSRSASLRGATEACGIFEQKDTASVPQREKTPVLCGLFFSRYLSETEESSVQCLLDTRNLLQAAVPVESV